MIKGRKTGDFNWDGNLLTVKSNCMVNKGYIYDIEWLNDLCFYHPEGNDYWYYIWNGECYHFIKYKSRYGFKEINEIV